MNEQDSKAEMDRLYAETLEGRWKAFAVEMRKVMEAFSGAIPLTVWWNNRTYTWGRRQKSFRMLVVCYWYDLANWYIQHILRWKCLCEYTYPYGFVCEADCPQHDRRKIE